MADVKLRFIVSDDGTVKVLEDVAAKTKGVGEEAEKSSARASKAFDVLKTSALATAAAVGAAITATGVAVGRQFQQIDELAKVSRATGVAVKDLSGLQVAADLAGVSLQGLGTSLGIFSRRIAEAQAGGKAGKIFDALGIDVNSGRSTQDLLEDVADRFAELGEGAETTALAMDLFGRSGARLINLLGAGGEAIRAARDEAALFGLVVDKDVSDAVEQVNDDLSRLSSLSVGFARDLVEATAPALAEVSKEAVAWASANREVIAQDLGEYLTNLVPVIRTVADGFIFANSILDEFAAGVANLIGTGNVYASSEIAQQVARRLQARGISSADLGDLSGRMSRMDADVPMSTADGSGRVADETAEVAREEERITDTTRTRAELLERIRAAARDTADASAAAARTGYGPGAMPLPFAGAIEEGMAQFRDQVELARAEAELVPGVINDWTQEFERAEAAAINLGDVLADSLTSAVDSLIAGGGFDLADVLEATGKAAMSRMVAAMLKEKLGFDATFRANFLEYLPGIAGQGADLISRNFGMGLQALAAQSANAGQVISGSMRANGVFGDTGFGMSLDPAVSMTDAGTGAAVIAPGTMDAAGSAAAAGMFGLGPGVVSALGIGGALGLGALAGNLAGRGAFGSRAESNASMFGLGVAGAALAPLTFGLAPLFMALFGRRAPSATERRRMAMGEAFRDSGIFPSLAFARDPSREFLDAPMPGFLGDITPEVSALSLLLGGTMNDSMSRLPRTIGSRASVLGLNDEQVRRELRRVAQSSGVSIDEAVGDLNNRFLEFQVNDKGSPITQDEYLDLLTGTVDLLATDLPRGVDASVIALANLETVGGQAVLNLEAFNAELERQTQIGTMVSGGLTGAAGNAATAILTGGANAGAEFSNAVLDAALGGVGQNVVTRLFADGGPLATFEEQLVASIFSDDPDALRSVLDGTGDAFALISTRLAEFVPIFDEFRQEIEDGLGLTSQDYRDQRASVRDIADDLRFSRLTPAQQAAELRARLARDRSALSGITDDAFISADERARFDRLTASITDDAQALFRLGGGYAAGSPQARAIEQEALAALGQLDSALELAVSSIEVGDMTVTNIYVDNVIYRTSSAIV